MYSIFSFKQTLYVSSTFPSYLIVTLPTGNDDLNLLILTPNREPAQTILYGSSLSQKYFKEVIALFQKKLLISSVIMILVMFFEWIYISSFCAVYKNSQLKFFVSILVCYGFANLIPFVYCLVPTIFKQDAVRDESKFSFFLASVFQMI